MFQPGLDSTAEGIGLLCVPAGCMASLWRMVAVSADSVLVPLVSLLASPEMPHNRKSSYTAGEGCVLRVGEKFVASARPAASRYLSRMVLKCNQLGTTRWGEMRLKSGPESMLGTLSGYIIQLKVSLKVGWYRACYSIVVIINNKQQLLT